MTDRRGARRAKDRAYHPAPHDVGRAALRQQAEQTLRSEVAELTEAAADALADRPQLREVLGLVER